MGKIEKFYALKNELQLLANGPVEIRNGKEAEQHAEQIRRELKQFAERFRRIAEED